MDPLSVLQAEGERSAATRGVGWGRRTYRLEVRDVLQEAFSIQHGLEPRGDAIHIDAFDDEAIGRLEEVEFLLGDRLVLIELDEL